MKRDKDSAEVNARLDMQTGIAYLNVAAWPKYAKKFARIYGIPKESWHDKHGNIVSAFWEVPLKCVSFRKLAGAGSKKRRGNPNIGKIRRKGR